MIMLIQNLGPGYAVWDKAATIRFLKPGRTTLYAKFTLDASYLPNGAPSDQIGLGELGGDDAQFLLRGQFQLIL